MQGRNADGRRAGGGPWAQLYGPQEPRSGEGLFRKHEELLKGFQQMKSGLISNFRSMWPMDQIPTRHELCEAFLNTPRSFVYVCPGLLEFPGQRWCAPPASGPALSPLHLSPHLGDSTVISSINWGKRITGKQREHLLNIHSIPES